MTLRLRPEARWATERYPVDEVREDRRGRITATFPVASRPWLERLLVRLGPAAEVVAPASWKHLPADAARRILERYERVVPD